jgi:hypothetical protein
MILCSKNFTPSKNNFVFLSGFTFEIVYLVYFKITPMKKYIVSLLLLPLLSCGNNKSKTEIPAKAYQIATSVGSSSINHSKWDALLEKHVSKNGSVNYKAFQQDSKQLEAYLTELSANVPSKSWSKNATLAYWINAYNAYTVQLILNNYPTKSIKDIKDPWGKKFFTLGNKKYSLEEIEHEILRKMNEPRIHFAINCASFSCPNLLKEAYTEAKLDQQLTTAAKGFVNDATKNTITVNKIEISKIFDWFEGDFEQNGSVIDFLNKYSTVKINSEAEVKYKDYNWSLND